MFMLVQEAGNRTPQDKGCCWGTAAWRENMEATRLKDRKGYNEMFQPQVCELRRDGLLTEHLRVDIPVAL